MIRILHLSDFHFSSNTQWDANPVLRQLIAAIKELVDDGHKPDVVAITGDVAQAGKRDQYEQAQRWLDERLRTDAALPDLPADRILIVPGNHDVDQDLVKKNSIVLASQKDLLESRDQNKIAAVLQDPAQRDFILKRHTDYLEFANNYGQPVTFHKEPWWSKTIDFDGVRVFFGGLCSSWMSWSDQDKGKLLIGRWQFNAVFNDEAAGVDFRVALLHHPWSYLADFDEDEIMPAVQRRADIILRGHRHAQAAAQLSDPDNICVELAAGCIFTSSQYPNAFQLIELDPNERVAVVHFRVWHNGQWIPDRNAYQNAPEGVATFALRQPPASGPKAQKTAKPQDHTGYLRRLRACTEFIDIRGLELGSGKATSLPIEQLYIPLATAGTAELSRKGREDDSPTPALEVIEDRSVDLRESLTNGRLVVVGDPGSGKSTFLRRLAFELARKRLDQAPPDADAAWTACDKFFPILISLASLQRHIQACRDRQIGPTGDKAPNWLAHCAATCCAESGDSLDESFFLARMQDADTIVLLDGLDEPATEADRRTIRKLIEEAARAFPCRFVVTTRPAAYKDDVVLAGFEEARIVSLSEAAVTNFLTAWCKLLFRDNKMEVQKHLQGLLEPIRHVADIRRLARNPVMLTALAVVHWNEKRLPEQRADLYESIIKWLSKARQARPDRLPPERCVELLWELALDMQDHPEGRQTQVTRDWGARAVAHLFGEYSDEAERVRRAAQFLKEEEVDSGIIVGRGEHELRFWHLTFQEYLAARALSACSETELAERFLLTKKIYQSEWREVVPLLGGCLKQRGSKLVDGMCETILSQLGQNPELSAKARCAGLLSAVLHDLAPMKYTLRNARYEEILKDAMAIFKAEPSQAIPIEEAIAAAEAIGQSGDPRFADLKSPDLWVTIPSGVFWMGAQNRDKSLRNYDPQAWGDGKATHEEPVHEVTLSEYRIGRYPVTVEEYALFVNDGGYENERFWTAGGFGRYQSPNGWDEQRLHQTRPVVNVCWYEARAFTAWADAGLWPGCRLPTEAEWERAAHSVDGRRYPWGDRKPTPRLLNFSESRIGCPTPVGVYPLGASPEVALDMAGNVWEWCNDWFGKYSDAAQINPLGPSSGKLRVLRGGGWINYAGDCRSAARSGSAPDDRGINLGFRCAAGTL